MKNNLSQRLVKGNAGQALRQVLRGSGSGRVEASKAGGSGEVLPKTKVRLEFRLEKMQFGGAPAF